MAFEVARLSPHHAEAGNVRAIPRGGHDDEKFGSPSLASTAMWRGGCSRRPGPTSACFSAAVGRHPSLHDAAEIIFFAFVVPHLSRDDATCRTTATAHSRSSLAGLARSASARKCTLTAPSSSASRANTGTKGSSQPGGPALSIGALAGASED
jgi:hypothetical protein